MALTLIDLTADKGEDFLRTPADMRHSKSDKMGSKRSFKELLAEEKESNRREFKHTKDTIRPKRQRSTSASQTVDSAKHV